MSTSSDSLIARTYPPAKLNLFLELLGKREDGFHEIDTIMVPIDWRDELRVGRSESGINLQVDWVPSLEVVAQHLGIDPNGKEARQLLRLPTDSSNLVYRALARFQKVFQYDGGFDVQLFKQIPAGAGMGGASSDAASALRCAAAITGIPLDDSRLMSIAAEIGSDVPFFLGLQGDVSISAARGTGRGERLEQVPMDMKLPVVVVFPAISLSTAKVYSLAQTPEHPQTPCRLIDLLKNGDADRASGELMNRLTEPAKKLAPRIGEVLESLWQLGPRACLMTGSGSACFAIANSSEQADDFANGALTEHQPGAFIRSVRTTTVPAPIDMIRLDDI